MGIFGRDEASPEQQPAKTTAGQSVSPTAPGTPERTLIARPAEIEGCISGSGEIVINGRVNGIIDASGIVNVAQHGRVEATVHGKVVSVAGSVNGDITADERIELEPTARVDGNITAPRILIQDGATFRGQVNMRNPEKRPTLRISSARKESDDSPE